LVCPGKGTAAEKACVSRIGAWVSRLDDQMAGRIDHGFFGLGVLAPQDKDYGLLPFVEELDDPIGKLLPTLSPVRVGLAPAYGQHGVEKQDALPRPVLEAAVIGNLAAQIVVKLFKDVL